MTLSSTLVLLLLGLLSGLHRFWDRFSQISLPVERFLVDFDDLDLSLDLRLLAAGHGHTATPDIDSVHSLLQLVVLLLVHHLLLLEVDLSLLSLPLLLLSSFLILDNISINYLEVLELLHPIF